MILAPLIDRLRRADPFRVDLTLGVLLALLALTAAQLADPTDGRPPSLLGAALILANTLPLALRRRYPVAVLITTGASAALYAGTLEPSTTATLGSVFALYTVAAICDRPRSIISLAWTLGGLSVSIVIIGVGNGLAIPDAIQIWAQNVIVYLSAWMLGDLMQDRSRAADELAERNRQLLEEREENARLAVVGERARIARDLHDVIAHSVSIMVVQASAARRSLESAPISPDPSVVEAIGSIESTGRQALTEMRRTVGGLRTSEADLRTPQPGLASLDQLLDQVRDAGLPVRLEVEGAPRPVPPGVDLSAYRVIQEALTNVMKHAGQASAVVRLRYAEASIEVAVEDDGRGAAAAAREPRQQGHGLIGMRERVGQLGGQIEAGPRLSGGYVVRAVMPLESGSAS